MSEAKTTQQTTDSNALSKVKDSQKQSWYAITFTWVGTMVCVPILITGATLVQGMSLGYAALAALIGFGFVAVLMCINGAQAADVGYPLSMLCSKIFGVTGSRVISVITGLSCMGWFGIQAVTCGAAFSQLVSFMGGTLPVWISTLFWGIVMLITAVFGFGWIKILNYIAVPLLFVMCIYGCIATANSAGMDAVNNYIPTSQMSLVDGITLTIGAIAVMSVSVADITRFAHDRADVVKSSLIGVVPGGVLLIFCGAFIAVMTGDGDITLAMAKVGLPLVGMVALILATWTTNTINAYSGGIAIMRVFQIKDSRRGLVTGIAGLIGTILAVAGIMNYFIGFLTILATIMPPIAGVLIADYWVLDKGKKTELKVVKGFNWCGLLAWAIGSAVGMYVDLGITPAVVAIVTAFVVYLVLYQLMGSHFKADIDPEETINL